MLKEKDFNRIEALILETDFDSILATDPSKRGFNSRKVAEFIAIHILESTLHIFLKRLEDNSSNAMDPIRNEFEGFVGQYDPKTDTLSLSYNISYAVSIPKTETK